MLKDKVAETLVEMLQHYVDEVQEEEDRSNFSDDYIVDKLLQVKENFHKDGVEEGRAYETHILITDKPVKIYDTVELRRMFSDQTTKMKVMSLESVKLSKNGSELLIEFLGYEVK